MKKIYLIAAALLTSSSLQQMAVGVPLTADEISRLRTYATAASNMRTNVHGCDNLIPRYTTDLISLFPKIYPNTPLSVDPKGELLTAAGTNQALRTTIEQRWNANLSNGFASPQKELWSRAIAARQAHGWDVSLLAAGAVPTNNSLSAFYNNAFISLMESINATLRQNGEISAPLAPPPIVQWNAADDEGNLILQQTLAESKRIADEESAQTEAALRQSSAATSAQPQQRTAEKLRRQQDLTPFESFLSARIRIQTLARELNGLVNRGTEDLHAHLNNLWEKYAADFRQSHNPTIQALPREFQKAFWDHATSVISQQPDFDWYNANNFRFGDRFTNYIAFIAAWHPEGIHILDPLVRRVLSQMLACPIDESRMDLPGTTADVVRVSEEFERWILQAAYAGLDETIWLRAQKNLTERFLQPKGQGGETRRVTNPTPDHWRPSMYEHEGQLYQTYNSYQATGATPARDAHYPSFGLRLEWQAGFLEQADALIRFVDSIPNAEVQSNLKRNLVAAMSEALELDGLCFFGNWTRWSAAIWKLGYTYINPANAQTGLESADLSWLDQMPRPTQPQQRPVVQPVVQPASAFSASPTPPAPSSQTAKDERPVADRIEAILTLLIDRHPTEATQIRTQFLEQRRAVEILLGQILKTPEVLIANPRFMTETLNLGRLIAPPALTHPQPRPLTTPVAPPVVQPTSAFSASSIPPAPSGQTAKDERPVVVRIRDIRALLIQYHPRNAFQIRAQFEKWSEAIESFLRNTTKTPEVLITNPHFLDALEFNKVLESTPSSATAPRTSNNGEARPKTTFTPPAPHPIHPIPSAGSRAQSPTQNPLDVTELRTKLSSEMRAKSTGFALSEAQISREVTALSSVAEELFPTFQGDLDKLIPTLVATNLGTLRRLSPYLQGLFNDLNPIDLNLNADNVKVRLLAGLAKAVEPNNLGDAITCAKDFFPLDANDDLKVAILSTFAKKSAEQLQQLNNFGNDPETERNIWWNDEKLDFLLLKSGMRELDQPEKTDAITILYKAVPDPANPGQTTAVPELTQYYKWNLGALLDSTEWKERITTLFDFSGHGNTQSVSQSPESVIESFFGDRGDGGGRYGTFARQTTSMCSWESDKQNYKNMILYTQKLQREQEAALDRLQRIIDSIQQIPTKDRSAQQANDLLKAQVQITPIQSNMITPIIQGIGAASNTCQDGALTAWEEIQMTLAQKKMSLSSKDIAAIFLFDYFKEKQKYFLAQRSPVNGYSTRGGSESIEAALEINRSLDNGDFPWVLRSRVTNYAQTLGHIIRGACDPHMYFQDMWGTFMSPQTFIGSYAARDNFKNWADKIDSEIQQMRSFYDASDDFQSKPLPRNFCLAGVDTLQALDLRYQLVLLGVLLDSGLLVETN